MTDARPRPRPPTDPFPVSHKLSRLAWSIAWALLAAWTPPMMVAWRRALLRLFGARMADTADVRGRARVWYPPHLVMEADTLLAQGVDCYNQAPITVRRGAIVSQGARLYAGGHDVQDPEFPLVARPIEIGEQAWIAAEAFVGPGVTIGARAVLGARGVTFSALQPDGIYVGNPARKLRDRKMGEA